MKKSPGAVVLTAVSLFLAVAAVDCSRKASAQPLEVTYYYLPG